MPTVGICASPQAPPAPQDEHLSDHHRHCLDQHNYHHHVQPPRPTTIDRLDTLSGLLTLAVAIAIAALDHPTRLPPARGRRPPRLLGFEEELDEPDEMALAQLWQP